MSVTISSVMSSPSQKGSSSEVSMIEGDSRIPLLPEACRLRRLLGLKSFLTVRPGVLALLGVTFGEGDGLDVGVL